MVVTAPTQWLNGPEVLYSAPNTFFYTAKMTIVAGKQVVIYEQTQNFQGRNAINSYTSSYTVLDEFGNVIQGPTPNTPVNTSNGGGNPVWIPAYEAQTGVQAISSTSSYLINYWDTRNSDGTYTIDYQFVDTTTGATTSQWSITGGYFPAAPAGTPPGNLGHVNSATIGDGNALIMYDYNSALNDGIQNMAFQVRTASTGALVFNGAMGSFADGTTHAWSVGKWNASKYAVLQEVYSGSGASQVSNIRLSTINNTTGVVTTGWTATVGLTDIRNISWNFLNGTGGMVLAVDAVNGGVAGHYEYIVDDTSSSGGTGGAILASTSAAYVGTVTQEARIVKLGDGTDTFIEYWVDGNGLNINVLNGSLAVIETMKIAGANSSARINTFGDGRFSVDWRVVSGDTAVAGATSTSYYDIFDTRTLGVSLAGTAGADILAGTAFNDTISVNGGDAVDANFGDDTFTSLGTNAGANTINGGGGFDKINYAIASGAATITRNANGTVTVSGTGFSDTLTGVEAAVFTDRTVVLREQARADFNGDGTSDVVLQNGGVVVDWTLQGGLYNAGNVLTTGASGFSVVGKGDFNGDGTADILLQGSGAVVRWTLINGVYTSGGVLATGLGAFNVVGTGDFNGDGTADVVLQGGNTVVAWTLQNGNYASGSVLSSDTAGFQVVGTGDFNADGSADVILQLGGSFVEWTLKNGAYQSGSVLATGATGYSVVGTGDFNRDGTTDVLIQNGNVVVEWLMQNGAYQSGQVLTLNTGGFQVVATGDYNNDGICDVLLQSGGSIVEWNLTAAGLYASGGVIATGATGFQVK